MATADKKRTNWLLMSVLVVSVAIHAVILVRISGIYASKEVEYIELEMLESKQPEARNIPTPPRPPRQDPPPAPREPNPVRTKAPRTPSPPKAPAVSASAPAVLEPVATPTRYEAPKEQATAWAPPEPPAPSAQPSGTTNDYFSLVRRKIENRKRYPLLARRNQQQGQVVARFTILPDGSVSGLELAGACPHASLNEAALAAVQSATPFDKPPPDLFKGPVSVEISIVFELT